MSPRQRLALWGLAVAGAIGGPVISAVSASFAPDRAAVQLTGALLALLSLSLILWLLHTTPITAIRLPTWASAALIGGGTAGLALPPMLMHGRALAIVLPVATLATIFLLWLARRVERGVMSIPGSVFLQPASCWVMCLYLWHPSLWTRPPFTSFEPSSDLWRDGARIAALITMVVFVTKWRSAATLALAWSLSCAFTLVALLV